MAKTLQGQVGIISGGLGDIGQAIALELATRGADVAVGDIHPADRARSLLRKIRARRRRCRYDRVDVADAGAVTEWVKAVETDLGLPNLIIPNAAIVSITRFPDLTPDEWRQQMAVNLDGVFHLALAVTQRLLRHRKQGRVVFIGSWAGHAVHTHIPAYCVAKAGLRMLCQCMAAELAPSGILVNEVAPGYVNAGLTGQFFKEKPPLRKQCQQQVPTGELIEPKEVASQVAHLCEPANRHMVGTTLLMDGGLSLFGCGGRRND